MIPSSGPPPKYELDDPSSLAPRWWDMRAWSKKKWAIFVAGIAALIIIIVVVAVEVEKKNAYPDYTALSYSLKDTCKLSSLVLCFVLKTSGTLDVPILLEY